MYTNIASLMSKFQEFLIEVNKIKPTIILITETWLKPAILDSAINIPQYTLYRKDRTFANGGGVCVYIADYISDKRITTKILENFDTDLIDSIWLNLQFCNVSFNIACIYRPPDFRLDQTQPLINAFLHASANLKNCIIFGDFNFPDLDWNTPAPLDNNSPSSIFMNNYLSTNFIQLIDQPTRFRQPYNPSKLDLIFVSDKHLASVSDYIAPIGCSDHIVITAKSQITISLEANKRTVLCRNFYRVHYEPVINHLQSLDWPTADLQSTWTNFLDNINNVIERYVPFIKKHPSSKPWITSTIRKEINKKRKLWHTYRNSNSPQDYLIYRNSCNTISSTIRAAKTEYEQQLVSSNSNKRFFKYVKRSLDSRVTSLVLRDSKGEVYSDPKIVADMFAKEFSASFGNEDINNLPSLQDHTRSSTSLESITITEEIVSSVIDDLKTDSSVGPDGIHPLFLKNCKQILVEPITTILKKSIAEGKLPLEWKSAVIIPVFKKGNKLDRQNYRQISLTSAICKCMEKIIAHEISDFLLAKGVLHDKQHGFLPGRSTVTNLLQCMHHWTKAMDSNQPVDVIYLDFKKAFDLVPHKRLLYKLEHYGIRGSLLNWIEDFLSDRKYQVRVDGVLSDVYVARSGVPQGSVLGPLLFNIFISDLGLLLESSVSLFADDTKFFANPRMQANVIRADIAKVEGWCNMWSLPLNDEKCTVLHIGYDNPKLRYFLNGAMINPVTQQRDLGITVTSDLKWAAHIGKTIKKVNSVVYMISLTFKNLSPELVLTIYKIYIRPILEYAVPVWNPYFAGDIHALEQVQRRITKLCPSIRNLPYERRLLKLGLTTLSERRLRGDLIETYKILHGHYSVNLNFFEISEDNRLRGHNYKLVRERFYKLCRQNFLCNRVHRAWNSLPPYIVDATSVNSFKNLYDNYKPSI